MGLEIFVSHSHFDTEFCVQLIDGLYKRIDEADIFFDRTGFNGGDRWLDVIQQEVMNRPIFIVILSPHSVKAQWVRTETGLALYEAVRNPDSRWVIPVKYKECRPRDLAPILELRHFIDCMEDVERGLDELATAIRNTSTGKTSHWLPEPVRGAEAAKDTEVALKQAADVHQAFLGKNWPYVKTVGEQVISKVGNENNAELFAEVGYACLQTAREKRSAESLEKALGYLTRAVELSPQRPDFLTWKAQACAQKDDLTTALVAWNEALTYTTSYQRKVSILSEMFEASIAGGQTQDIQRAHDFADAAVGFLYSIDVEDGYQHGWLYWANMCASVRYYERAIEAIDQVVVQHPSDQSLKEKRNEWDRESLSRAPGPNPIPVLPDPYATARSAALNILPSILAELEREGRLRDFPSVNLKLQQRGVRYRDLGFSRFRDFMQFSVDAGKVKVDWVHWLVYLPGEPEPTVRPRGAAAASAKSAPAAELNARPQLHSRPKPDERRQFLRRIDLLEKSLPFVTFQGIVKRAGVDKAVATRLATELSASGILLRYSTEMIYDQDGVGRQFNSALRLNRQSAEADHLYDDDTSAWASLSDEGKRTLVVMLQGLAGTHDYLTWNLTRTFLHAQDGEVDWNVALATAIDAEVILVANRNVENRQTRKPFTIRAISLNTAHLDVVGLLVPAAATVGSVSKLEARTELVHDMADQTPRKGILGIIWRRN